jgi:SAM-dependent methyltransferase
MAQPDPYFLGYRQAEQQRLQRQAQQLAEDAAWLFDQIGIPLGAHALEIGCGPQGCLALLAERVGPQGMVVGVERSEDAVQLARQFIAEHQLPQVEVRLGDGKATGLPRESFDLVFARLVLVNIPQPEHLVNEMVALVRPGGTVALQEADWSGHLLYPPLPAWPRLFQLLEAYSQLNGIDLFIGRRVPSLLRAAGLVDVQIRPLIHVYPHGHERRLLYWQFLGNLRERLLAAGLVTEVELTQLMADLKHHLDDPDTLMVSNLHFQVWGRKPGS